MDKARVQEIIGNLLKTLTVEFTRVEISEEAGQTLFMVRTSDSGILIGSNGETLRAFNTLVRKIAERQLGTEKVSGFMVDVNGYYGKRIREIKQQAKMLGDRARTFKSDIEMEPMNPYERMIVHALFSSDPDVYTESRGEGRTRHIVLRFRASKKELFPSDSSLFA